MSNNASLTIDSKYHRGQFDDWLAGGKIEYKGEIYNWSAQNNNYGLGWEIEPVNEEDWNNIVEDEFNKIIKFIEKCLYEHKIEYALGLSS